MKTVLGLDDFGNISPVTIAAILRDRLCAFRKSARIMSNTDINLIEDFIVDIMAEVSQIATESKRRKGKSQVKECSYLKLLR